MTSNLEKMADKVVDKMMKNMPLVFGPSKLKDLIKAVRSCKTAAEEREVIAKESAAIRTSFKEGNPEFRHRNVAKLLYIHMLGYSAQFGQIECIKLAASPRFADKRLGYLGVVLLLDENQEVLTLVTNSIKNDLNHPNMYVVGLALSTLANISSSEMARDLVGETEKLLDNSHSYVRKKAALAAIRIIQKEPELHENFITKARNILGEKNHAVLLTGLTLVYELCKMNHDFLVEYRQNIPTLVKLLKAVCAVAQSAEHEVNGVSDPFLQVKIIALLRLLGHGSPEASDSMSDVLAQVATNTDSTKNVGNSILYETVKTIMNIESESGLRVLAINILGKFLSNNAENRDKRDNNIRYVALNTLLTTIDKDMNAVQRHRKTVVECLRDPDISIRRRALDLSFELINESNVRVMIRELLTFLEKADKEFKPKITSEICSAAEVYAPNKRWHIDTILRTLRLAGNFVKDDILSNFVRLVITSPELHSYAGHKLYKAVKDDMSQEYLVYAAVWVIGEYGDAIIREVPVNEEEDDSPITQVTENDIIDLLESIMKSPFTTVTGREYTLMALMKLSTRFSSQDRIKQIIRSYTNHINSEIQQRAAEFTAMFDFDSIRTSLLEKMPPPEAKSLRKEAKASTGEPVEESERPQISQPSAPLSQPKQAPSSLLDIDLMGDVAPVSTATKSSGGGMADLSELLGLSTGLSAAPAPSTAPMSRGGNLLDDLGLGGLGGSTAPQPSMGMGMGMGMGMNMGMNMGMGMGMNMGMTAPAPAAAGPYYEKNGLKAQMDCQIDPTNPAVLNVNTTFFNTTVSSIDNLNFQVAVPKTLKLQILPPSSTTVPAFGTATQVFRIANPTKAPIKVRLRITFVSNGMPFEDTADLGGFPQM